MKRRKFLTLAGATVFTAACQKGTEASVPKISHNEEALQTSNNSGANNTPKNHRPRALHEKALEICNPTVTEAATSISSQFLEANKLIEKNIRDHEGTVANPNK